MEKKNNKVWDFEVDRVFKGKILRKIRGRTWFDEDGNAIPRSGKPRVVPQFMALDQKSNAVYYLPQHTELNDLLQLAVGHGAKIEFLGKFDGRMRYKVTPHKVESPFEGY